MKSFKLVTATLFLLQLLALARLTEVYLSTKENGAGWILKSTYFQLTGAIVSLLLIAFLFIRSNFNEWLKKERKLMQAYELEKSAEEKLRKLLEEERELKKVKSDFVQMASHELRSPLTLIHSSAYLLEKYSLANDSHRVQMQAAKIRKAIKLLTVIIDDCLAICNIEDGKVEVEVENFNVRTLARECCSELQESAKPGQKICYSHNGRQCIGSDAFIVRNILDRLINNAVKYSPENSVIRVSTSVDSTVEIFVKDLGIGIPKSEQKNLFDRFYRASNTANLQGTGLGLHIIRHYVAMLQGSIEVTSDLNQGAEFHITLKDFSRPDVDLIRKPVPR